MRKVEHGATLSGRQAIVGHGTSLFGGQDIGGQAYLGDKISWDKLTWGTSNCGTTLRFALLHYTILTNRFDKRTYSAKKFFLIFGTFSIKTIDIHIVFSCV